MQNCQQIEVLAALYEHEMGAQEIKRLVGDHMKAYHSGRN